MEIEINQENLTVSFCCLRMMNSVFEKDGIHISNKNTVIKPGNYMVINVFKIDGRIIEYCPFCGKKVPEYLNQRDILEHFSLSMPCR